MSLSTDDGRPYVVPDFAADEDIRFQYNSITKQLIRRAPAPPRPSSPPSKRTRT
jgi:hypothetical protein